MRNHADVFKAMADETRLMILTLIVHHQECCVCDVMEICAISQSKASRHLRYLKHANLVTDRREGAWVYYSLDARKEPAAAEILEASRPLLEKLYQDELAHRVLEWNQRKVASGTCQKDQNDT